MPPVLIASLTPGEGRTTTAAALGAILAQGRRTVRLARMASEIEPAAAEDDARALSLVPGCDSSGRAISDQEARTLASETASSNSIALIDTSLGASNELAAQLSARVVLVTARSDNERLDELASAAAALGGALAGTVVLRQSERGVGDVRSAFERRGLRCLAAVPEDRALAGPTVRELAAALHASRLADGSDDDEGVEYVMLGPISSDPGQPYFLQHGSKAVVNRFDKMDLHLAALATEPDCLVLTGGQKPSPYLLDRVAGGEDVTVLLAPEDTVRTIEIVDTLYGATRFSGRGKLARAIELFQQHFGADSLRSLFE